MQNLAKVLILSVISFFFGCASDKYEIAIPEKHSITIINFGGADSSYNKVNTKGFGINYYAFIDLNSDSVFVRQKYELEEPIRVIAKAGFIKNLSQNDTILEGLAALKIVPNGFIEITDTQTNGPTFYCGPHIFLEYNNGDVKDYYFFTHHNLNSSIKNLSRLLMSLTLNPEIQEINPMLKFNEDSILLVSITLKGI